MFLVHTVDVERKEYAVTTDDDLMVVNSPVLWIQQFIVAESYSPVHLQAYPKRLLVYQLGNDAL